MINNLYRFFLLVIYNIRVPFLDLVVISLNSLSQGFNYVVSSISFQTFFVQAFKIVVDSWKFSMLLLYILWDDWLIFMISGSNEQLQQQLEYTLLKPDCHRWWISIVQSGREDTLEERYAIKFCFKLGKNATESYGVLFDHLAWIEHRFLSGIERFKEGRESVRDDERCGRSKKVNTPELIGQSPKLRGCRYETIEEMKEAVTKVIDTLTQEDFHGAFQKLLERYNKCIAAGGDYFEGD